MPYGGGGCRDVGSQDGVIWITPSRKGIDGLEVITTQKPRPHDQSSADGDTDLRKAPDAKKMRAGSLSRETRGPHVFVSLQVGWIVEQHRQLDTAMAILRKVRLRWILRIERRCGVIRRKQDQRIEKCEYCVLVIPTQSRKRVARSKSLSPMAKNDIVQCHAATIVAIGTSAADTPQWACQESRLQRAIPISLVEIRAQIVTFEISEEILHQERVPLRQLEQGKAAAIILSVKERVRGGEKAVKHSVRRVVVGFDVGDATIMIDPHACDVAGAAADTVENRAAAFGGVGLLVMSGFEVVHQIELEMIYKRRIDLVSVLRIRRWRRADFVFRSVEHHAGRSDDSSSRAGGREIGIRRSFKPHLLVKGSDHELTDRYGRSFRKEWFNAQIGIDAYDS